MARQQKLSDKLKTLSMLVGHEECSDTAAWLELFHVNALNSEDENGELCQAVLVATLVSIIAQLEKRIFELEKQR
ncbi:hypothetical protein [Corynebacterium hindlerae]|uniref:hypothetical protein n=1 Tax=Corynebacterium hindlerae TaxID=699041 RepID=UPI001C71257F|nr:hypothetical protein [Corynebacterium hindlerae]